jgi:hypothetical protein
MADIDQLARTLLEEAKRFYEKAQDRSAESKQAHLHASLMLAFCSFEAHLNSIAADFSTRPDLNVMERAIIVEEDVKLVDGQFELSGTLKMYRLADRFEFLFRRFSGAPLDRTATWWGVLKSGMGVRNELTHPKQNTVVTDGMVKSAISAIIDALDAIYKAVYKRPYPAKNRALQSTLTF